MTTNLRRSLTCGLLAATLALGACSTMSPRTRDTAIGAAVGGVAGSLLTNGNAAGVVGGAAIGGLIGDRSHDGR